MGDLRRIGAVVAVGELRRDDSIAAVAHLHARDRPDPQP